MLMFDCAVYLCNSREVKIFSGRVAKRQTVRYIVRFIFIRVFLQQSGCLFVVEGNRERERERERERGRKRSLIVHSNFSHRQRDCRRPRRFSAFPPRFSCSAIFALSASLPLSPPPGIVHRTKKGTKVSFPILAAPSLARSTVRVATNREKKRGWGREKNRRAEITEQRHMRRKNASRKEIDRNFLIRKRQRENERLNYIKIIMELNVYLTFNFI